MLMSSTCTLTPTRRAMPTYTASTPLARGKQPPNCRTVRRVHVAYCCPSLSNSAANARQLASTRRSKVVVCKLSYANCYKHEQDGGRICAHLVNSLHASSCVLKRAGVTRTHMHECLESHGRVWPSRAARAERMALAADVASSSHPSAL
jgi:hypothetical protein